MDRRRLLASVGGALGLTALAGCGDDDPVAHRDEEGLIYDLPDDCDDSVMVFTGVEPHPERGERMQANFRAVGDQATGGDITVMVSVGEEELDYRTSPTDELGTFSGSHSRRIEHRPEGPLSSPEVPEHLEDNLTQGEFTVTDVIVDTDDGEIRPCYEES